MQSPKKVAKYLGTPVSGRVDRLDDTLAPGALQPEADAPIRTDFDEDPLHVHSLTPVRVLEKIRRDIIAVLGITESIAGKFTRLEQKLVDYLERIVRKGQCPSILVKDRDLIEALLSLKKYFETDSVVVAAPDQGAGGTLNIPVFPALYKYAKDADFCEQRIRELRSKRSRAAGDQRKAVDAEIRQLRERKDNCLIFYQKIIFSDAEARDRQGGKRTVTLFGKEATLDDLITFFKKGGRLDQARASAPATAPVRSGSKPAPGMVSEDTLGTFDRTDTLEEVVDWRHIKSTPERGGDEQTPFNFNL